MFCRLQIARATSYDQCHKPVSHYIFACRKHISHYILWCQKHTNYSLRSKLLKKELYSKISFISRHWSAIIPCSKVLSQYAKDEINKCLLPVLVCKITLNWWNYHGSLPSRRSTGEILFVSASLFSLFCVYLLVSLIITSCWPWGEIKIYKKKTILHLSKEF